jgi:hypothetical protein
MIGDHLISDREYSSEVLVALTRTQYVDRAPFKRRGFLHTYIRWNGCLMNRRYPTRAAVRAIPLDPINPEVCIPRA